MVTGLESHTRRASLHYCTPVPAPPPPPAPNEPPPLPWQGKTFHDRGSGRPDFMVADIASTAALMRTAADASPKDFFHSSRLLLFFDVSLKGPAADREGEAVALCVRVRLCVWFFLGVRCENLGILQIITLY
jgi:hypothetical protein